MDFRNLTEQHVDFSERINFFIGDNGQGKSNLLEAVSLFTLGESFRYCDNINLIKDNKNEAALFASIEKNNLQYDLKLQILKSRRNFFTQNKKTSQIEIRKKFHAVVFSPESLSSIKEGADQRRILVDELIQSSSLRNIELLYEFRKALKTRNKILKDHTEKKQSLEITQRLLESLNPSYIRLATELAYQRIKTIREILPEFNNAMRHISKDSTVEISVDYLISGENSLNFTQEQINDSMQKRQRELIAAEMAAGSTLVGPHKHEIVFLYNQKDSRFYCSQGQQRAIILSFKMAQVVYYKQVHGEYPVLLLDDVLSELDVMKKAALISFLHEIRTQTFITSTDLTLPENFRLELASVFTLREGKIL